MIRSLESWKYLCENHYVDIPMPKGNETDEELDDHAVGCGFAVENGLKALEIISEKRVQLDTLFSIFTYHKEKENSVQLSLYNSCVGFPERKLTQEEFDLLREVLL